MHDLNSCDLFRLLQDELKQRRVNNQIKQLIDTMIQMKELKEVKKNSGKDKEHGSQ